MESNTLSLEDKALFIHNSNAIESIHLGYDITLDLLMHPEKYPGNIKFKILDVGDFYSHHITDHFKALEYVLRLDNKMKLGSDTIRLTHLNLMRHIYDNFDTNPGEFRKKRNNHTYIGPVKEDDENIYYYEPPLAQDVTTQMLKFDTMIKELDEKESVSVEDCWNVHDEFQSINPFSDGNGRVGRLFLNALLLRHGHDFHSVLFEKRKDYYKHIVDYEVGKNKGTFIKTNKHSSEKWLATMYELDKHDQLKFGTGN